MTALTHEQHDAFVHSLIRQRVQALLAGDLTGRKLADARELLAYTLIGHERWFPDCERTAAYGRWSS